VAAANVYQESVLQPWTDLSGYVAELNGIRRLQIVRAIAGLAIEQLQEQR
jgi:hypothetical protein